MKGRKSETTDRARERRRHVASFCSYNIQCCIDAAGVYDLRRTANAIKALEADAVFLQEVSNHASPEEGWAGTTRTCCTRPDQPPFPHDQLWQLQNLAGYEHGAYFGTHDLAEYGRQGTFGIGFLSRFPILEKKSFAYRRFAGRQGRGALAVEIDLTAVCGTRLWCVCTHLQKDLTGYEQECQVKELLAFCDSLGAADRLVLAGDFNVCPAFRALRLLIARFGGAGVPKRTTFPLLRCGLGLVLDCAFTGRESVVALKNVVLVEKTNASDHYPILLDMRHTARARPDAREAQTSRD